jgi:hypothetical protein
MIRQRFLFTVLVVLVAAAAPSTAQAQRFFGSRTNSLVSLAANEAVQKELGITGEKATKLNGLYDEYRNASQKEFTSMGIDYSAIGDLPAAERAVEMRKASEKTAELNRKLAAQFAPKLEELVTREQLQRLKEIQLQANGIDAWTEPEVAKVLDLTEQQKAKLTELRNDYNRRQQQLDGDFQQRFARIRELNTERDKRALELLTADQRAKLTELQGPPFDVSQLGFGRRRNNN